jgi:hypothetical protein
VFENRVQKRIFRPKREKMVGGRRKLLIEELRNWYIATNVVRVMKSRRMKWVGYVAHGGNGNRWEDNVRMNLKRDRLAGCELDSSGSG